MRKCYDIIGIGDASVDIMVDVPRLPRHDEKVKGRILGKYPGGIVSNFLCAATAFGAKCGAVICVGQDDYGEIALNDLKARGIDTEKCVIHEDDTYFNVICLDETGEKSMLICLNQSTQPYFSEIDLDYLQKAHFVHMIGTYSELVRAVGKYAKQKGFYMSLDFERQAFEIPIEQRQELCALAEIAFPNEEGLRYMTECEDIVEGAMRMLDWGSRIVVVTRGAKGVDVFTQGTQFHVPAFQVEVKDTTGAGDTFNACFLACYVKKYSLEHCAKLATAAAACQIQKIGSRSGMVSEEEAEIFLSQNKTVK